MEIPTTRKQENMGI